MTSSWHFHFSYHCSGICRALPYRVYYVVVAIAPWFPGDGGTFIVSSLHWAQDNGTELIIVSTIWTTQPLWNEMELISLWWDSGSLNNKDDAKENGSFIDKTNSRVLINDNLWCSNRLIEKQQGLHHIKNLIWINHSILVRILTIQGKRLSCYINTEYRSYQIFIYH